MIERPILGPVDSERGLERVVSELLAANPGCLLLFRGQTSLYPTMRSGLARPDVRYQPDVEQGWRALAGNILGHDSLTPDNIPFRMAVLQHYGLKTYYVDVTADALIAAWFAVNEFQTHRMVYGGTPFRSFEQISYKAREEGIGYVLVVVLKNFEELKTSLSLFDISSLDPFLRPHRQHAWLLRDRKPLLPDPNDYWSVTISVDCSRFRSRHSTRYLFPPPKEDAGFSALLNQPCVEIPSGWLAERRAVRENNKEVMKPKIEINFGMRALDVPEYLYLDGVARSTDEYNHKWNDQTLTEPKPMQMWMRWQFELSSEFEGIHGNVGESTKITISPRAHKVMRKAVEGTQLRWPNLGTDELLFVFSQYGHDKVIEIEYPYHGVWLHRDKDLVLEHPMTADENSLDVHAGHVFEFIGQELRRQRVLSSCPCESPESHLTC